MLSIQCTKRAGQSLPPLPVQILPTSSALPHLLSAFVNIHLFLSASAEKMRHGFLSPAGDCSLISKPRPGFLKPRAEAFPNHRKSKSDIWFEIGISPKSPNSAILSQFVWLTLHRSRKSSRDKNSPFNAASTI